MLRAAASLMGVLLLGACAPSVRMVHQNAEYFERCQAADYDPSVSMATRHACWSRWIAHYTAEQPRDRVRHAHERLAAIEAGNAIEPLPGLDGPPVDAAHAPAFLSDGGDDPLRDGPGEPPSTADPSAGQVDDAAVEETDDRPPLRRPPRDRTGACSDMCLPAWERCARACDDRADGCIKSCEAEYRVCVAACP